jgi:hypothetical protein
MKAILSLLEFKLGKGTEDYKYLKSQIMDSFYNGLLKLYKKLEAGNILERCTCGAHIRLGYQKCDHCSGCGYKNKV